MSNYPDNFNAHAFNTAFGNGPSTNASDEVANMLVAVMGMSPDVLRATYGFSEKQVKAIIKKYDGDYDGLDAMDIRNFCDLDTWTFLVGIYEALTIGLAAALENTSGYYDDVVKQYHAHMDGFKTPAPVRVFPVLEVV